MDDDRLPRTLGHDLATAIVSSLDRPLATVEAVAKVLGLGRSAAYEAVRRGDLPSVRIGRRVFVPIPQLANWLVGSED